MNPCNNPLMQFIWDKTRDSVAPYMFKVKHRITNVTKQDKINFVNNFVSKQDDAFAYTMNWYDMEATDIVPICQSIRYSYHLR